jgi:hypothetical protein
MNAETTTALTQQDISRAKLPETYKAAKEAIKRCVEIDECAEWSDKAARMAAYARMAKDNELLRAAQRIQDHAVRQIGELIKLIKPAPGQRNDQPREGTHPRLSPRQEAIRAAALSDHQAKTALRVANIP